LPSIRLWLTPRILLAINERVNNQLIETFTQIAKLLTNLVGLLSNLCNLSFRYERLVEALPVLVLVKLPLRLPVLAPIFTKFGIWLCHFFAADRSAHAGLFDYLGYTTGTSSSPMHFFVCFARTLQQFEAFTKDGGSVVLGELVLFFKDFEVVLEGPTNKIVCLFANGE
jgi:hypothetical protein